jgi:hypothetical protein
MSSDDAVEPEKFQPALTAQYDVPFFPDADPVWDSNALYRAPGGPAHPPPDVLPNAMIHQIDARLMNDLLSNSPVQTDLSPQALNELINGMFCKVESIGRDDDARARVAVFLRHCCAAIIYYGQQEQRYQHDRWLSISRAVNVFSEIMCKHPWDTLTTLNHMRCLLGQYGHKVVVQDILKQIDHAVSTFREQDQQSMFASVIQTVLNFMMVIPAVGNKPNYNIDDLRQMEERAWLCFEGREEFGLSATYMHAWALLEMKRNALALRKLSEFRPACEEVFGYGQCQTISWIATLARAHAYVGQNKMAANTYRDVAGRIAYYFDEWHPQFWDSRYRQACFDMRVINDFEDQHAQRQGWLHVAQTLRNTLLNKAQLLGRPNPETLQNLKACEVVLRKLKKIEGSATFEQVMAIDLSQ